MLCVNCGSELPDGSEICTNCGNKIVTDSNIESFDSKKTNKNKTIILSVVILIIAVIIGGYISYKINISMLEDNPLRTLNRISDIYISKNNVTDKYEIAKIKQQVINAYVNGNDAIGMIIEDLFKEDLIRSASIIGLLAIIFIVIYFNKKEKKIIMLYSIICVVIIFFNYKSQITSEIDQDLLVRETETEAETGYKTIADAFQKWDWYSVGAMIVDGAEVNVESTGGGSMLASAILYDKLPIVELMLEYGADPNSLDAKGDPVLIFALQCKKSEMAEMLLSYGADVNKIDRQGNNALYYFIDNDDVEMVENILDNGVLPESIDVKNYSQALFSNEYIAELLYEKNPDLINGIIEPEDWPITHDLQNSSNDELVVYLLEKGANINSQDEDGNTLLHKYVKYFNYEMVNTLMQIGADKNIENNNGESPVDIVYNSNPRDDTIKNVIINIFSK